MPTDSAVAPQAAFWAAILGRAIEPAGPILIPQIAGRRVLVTGAGGFIGAEMVRVFAASGAAQIVLLDIAEHALFAINREMTELGHDARCIPILGSVCDRSLLDELFREHRPELVLHAAALKHVPLMERNPFAAVETNSLGSLRITQAALEHGAEQIILVSTDKAVAPHSIMGASKRIAELAMLAGHRFTSAVRLVNVIGSPGSVAPLFAEQIAHGGPILVTHPAVRRFFLTLHEVVTLLAQVLFAPPAHGIFVPDPGDPLLIVDLARRMIAASGCNIPIVFTELRPGDKLEESIVAPLELLAGDTVPGLRRVMSPTCPDFDTHMSALESAVAARDLPLLLRIVESLVPDYEPQAFLQSTDHAGIPAP